MDLGFSWLKFLLFTQKLNSKLAILTLQVPKRGKTAFPSQILYFKMKFVLFYRIQTECKVGKDEFGYILADILKENNVDNSGVRFDPHARTALAFVGIFHYGSISLIEEPCRSAHLAAMDACCILSYDPNLRLPLWPSTEAARKRNLRVRLQVSKPMLLIVVLVILLLLLYAQQLGFRNQSVQNEQKLREALLFANGCGALTVLKRRSYSCTAHKRSC
ncbi:hypothetical protein DVH24_014123 [Malus domestica]|uniref:Carbohydrate kinase PfkB domain-containing protein n=1 Tax=Malus domestica TaxID=3750 RepID=A0A498JFH1_MALDO|nr:hypothetical protein DVH24_014123 [Malus domestica]